MIAPITTVDLDIIALPSGIRRSFSYLFERLKRFRSEQIALTDFCRVQLNANEFAWTAAL
jgi:hypothetical protein